MILTLASVVGIHPGFQLGWAQGVVRVRDRTLAMHPLGLNGIEPRAFHRQPTGHNPHPLPARFDVLIMGANPRLDGLALMPRGVIPEEQQGGDTLHCQAGTAPGQKICRHGADGAPRDKPELHLLGVLRMAAYQQSITRQGFRVGIIRSRCQFLEAGDVSGLDPAMLVRLRQAAPPDFIGKAERPGRVGSGQPDQAVAPFFFLR